VREGPEGFAWMRDCPRAAEADPALLMPVNN
jgi:hypothetical protein